MSDKWFDAICGSFFLLRIFMIKCVAFSLRNFETRFWNENEQNVEFSASQNHFSDYRT